MTDYEKEEFWKSLGRLYDSTLVLKQIVDRLAEVALSHEQRLDQTDKTLNSILDELKRLRGGGA